MTSILGAVRTLGIMRKLDLAVKGQVSTLVSTRLWFGEAVVRRDCGSARLWFGEAVVRRDCGSARLWLGEAVVRQIGCLGRRECTKAGSSWA